MTPLWLTCCCRFVLADTEQLHRKIAEMSERIRQLEDALAIFQAGISSERHPLLRDELLTIKKQLVRINYQYFPGMCGGGKYLWLIMEKYDLEALEQKVEKTIAAIEGLSD